MLEREAAVKPIRADYLKRAGSGRRKSCGGPIRAFKSCGNARSL
jgi:hypothetical protein